MMDCRRLFYEFHEFLPAIFLENLLFFLFYIEVMFLFVLVQEEQDWYQDKHFHLLMLENKNILWQVWVHYILKEILNYSRLFLYID